MRIAISLQLNWAERRNHNPWAPYDIFGSCPMAQESPLLEEIKRNCFWLAYAQDRHLVLGFGWSQFLGDSQVDQYLPGPLDSLFRSVSLRAIN
jgi:hypothetical protein